MERHKDTVGSPFLSIINKETRRISSSLRKEVTQKIRAVLSTVQVTISNHVLQFPSYKKAKGREQEGRCVTLYPI